MDTQFCYKPLDDAGNSIRLLRILSPTDGSDTIYCSLLTARLDKKPSYEALSYVWGSERSSTPIQCDGRDRYISRNLYQALLSLQRLKDSADRLFWIDAICINQDDIAERSSQVGLMSHIYKAARNVIVWPGESASDGHQYGNLKSVNGSMVDLGLDDNQRHGRSLRGSVLKYLKAPIFRRAWVFQEILCSRNTSLLLEDGETEWETFWGRAAIETITSIVISGDRALPPASMAAFQFYTATSSIKFITSSSEALLRVPPYDGSYEKARESLSGNALASQWAWAKTLDFTATLNTNDPRDRVFALVGLADALGIIVPKPDYSKPTRVVFQDALSMLRTRPENSPSPHQLAAATALQHPSRGLPFLVRPRSDDFKKYLLGNWQFPSENSPSPQTGGTKSGEGPELSYHAFFDQILQHHKRLLCISVSQHLAGEVPNAPLTCPGGADSTRTTEDQQGPGLQLATVSDRTRVANARSIAKRKRRGRPSRLGEDDDEDDEEDGDERQIKKQTLDPWNRLACPYFQRNMECPRLRTACRGPGFETTARLKEHLYRAHHIHPCLRCGKIFESREAVSQHSQLIQACNLVPWRESFNPSQGFEDLQKEKLGKKTVRTWQQIFSILFPRDDPNTYPPQHYSNTGFVQLLDQFHQHYLAESRRVLPQRLANDSSTIHGLHQGQPGQLEAYVLQLANDIFAQIIGTFRAELIRTPPPGRDVLELAPHTADHALRLIEAALPHGEEPMLPPSLQPMLQSAPPSSRVGAIPDPVVAFEQYLTRFAPAGTFDDLPDLFEGAHDVAHGRQEYDWEWEDLGPGSG
ncbi:heterokaryon incompatibility protein-domain-containing protein [Rhypophila decipiens]|uniref:Heterokaryon incompatibility protein-domain-containing protein n=1 Tax=Rhypophila decipiens TaxID=261697 RepID=A0AAN6Y6W0_9PEZI|nr:heterokaryon incompatibility protein-domain-containing protein [Rhypophila decipiens]